jgi:hypothetical protein
MRLGESPNIIKPDGEQWIAAESAIMHLHAFTGIVSGDAIAIEE